MGYIQLDAAPAAQRAPLHERPEAGARKSLAAGIAQRRKALLAALMVGVGGASGIAQAECWEAAGREFSIPPALLYAIAEQESGLNPRAIGHNRDGSRDIGLMQINSRHLPRLARQRITEKTLLADSCQSVRVGAAILADFMRRYGYSWEAVGAYNAGAAGNRAARQRRMRYAGKIAVRYQRLLTRGGAPASLAGAAPQNLTGRL